MLFPSNAAQLRGNRNIVGMLGVCGTTVAREYFPTNVVIYAFQSRERLSIRAIVSMSLDAARGLQVGVHVMDISPTDGAFCPVHAKKRNRLAPWPSPENYAGQTSDIYSMVMFFYSLLPGTRPFRGPEGLAEAFETRTHSRPLVDPSWHRGFAEICKSISR
ncbi:unnamed protein product [Ectocarpus sp. CCAP 1310/34]|nr:unnamed protein product [Ectocarpus sp. CCAP 1310/34]